ncbi:MAG: glycosyltransferase family 4 protein [Chloroflexota bacterium]
MESRIPGIELVEHAPPGAASGIGRYNWEIRRHLEGRVPVRVVREIDPPMAGRFTSLHHLPLGIRGHQSGHPVHFTQIMGCSQMLWRPVRPAVATVHDLGSLVWRPEGGRPTDIATVLFRLSLAGLKRMDAIVADSRFTAQAVVDHLGIPVERVHVVPIGVDHETYDPVPDARQLLASRYPLPGGPSTRYLLHVGSESPRKNVVGLLRALAVLRERVPDVYLLRVGDPGSPRFREETLRIAHELGLADRVAFYGQVPEADLPVFYSAADVCVVPSFLEGFGLPVVEAQASGAPVVASDIPALRELSLGTVSLVDSGDPAALAGAIEFLLKSRPPREKAAWTLRYSWEAAADGLLNVYLSVLAGSRSAGNPVRSKR